MQKKEDRIVQIVNSEESLDYASVRDELFRISGTFSALEQLRLQDLERLRSRVLDATGRLLILSQVLLPQLCSIIERGLTLEEIGLFLGLDLATTKRVIKKPMIEKAAIISLGMVEKEDFVKILVPLKTTVRTNEGKVEERPVREPLLAPKRLVNTIQRTGYITREGRVLRHDYISLVSGPLPTVYVFESGEAAIEGSMGEGWKALIEERMADDQGAIKAKLEIAIAVLRLLRPLFRSEIAPIIARNYWLTSSMRPMRTPSIMLRDTAP